MRNKGYLLILIPLLITTILWVFAKVYREQPFEIFNYASTYIAVIATTLISLQFILAAKFKFVEDSFNGLDRVFNVHHKIGKYAFMLILLHPLLLILKAIPNYELAKLYIFPSSLLSYNLGIYTLWIFSVLLIFSLVIKLPFKYWRISHDFMGIPLLTLLGHIMLVSSDVAIYMPLRIWMLSLVIIAIATNFYLKAIYERKRYQYSVTNIKQLTKSVIQLKLKLDDTEKRDFKYEPGQFIFISFPNFKELKQYHPFTISSGDGSEIVITAKIYGPFTQSLSRLGVGDMAYIQGPYGRFNNALKNENSLWIAGGIGITPFMSAQRESSIIMHQIKENNDFQIRNRIGKYFKYVSSEGNSIKTNEIINTAKKYNIENIILCGPSGFVKRIIKELVEAGWNRKNIYYEQFELYSD